MAAFRKTIPLLDAAFDKNDGFETNYKLLNLETYSPEQGVSYWINQ